MIWIVGGPSSSGKSWFLQSGRAQEVTGLPGSTRVWFPKEIGPDGPAPGEDAFIHYNILRPVQKSPRPQDVPIDAHLFESDKQWRAIVSLPGEKKAVVVVTGRAELITRVKNRVEIEAGRRRAYDSQKWLRIYNAVSVDAIYREWRAELARRGIASVDVDGGV